MALESSTPVKRIEFLSPEGITLSALLTEKTNAPSNQVVILCHGFLNHSNSSIIRGLTSQLPYNICAVDFRGNGFSTGTTKYGNYLEEVVDLKNWVDHLRDALNFKVLGIVGHSKGGSVVLLYASKYNQVPLIVNIAARFDMSDLPMHRFTAEQLTELEEKGCFVWRKYKHNTEEKDFIVSQMDLTTKKNTDMSVVKNVDKERVRVLSVHGEEDTIIPVEEVKMYDQLMGPKPHHEVAVITEASHFFRTPEEQKELSQAIINWMDKYFNWAQDILFN
ncbi:hypothetical protein K7432_005365 [Basidiobolus ranarum]|uniref:Serine aminopeptidase S33 domain-containing protein n=1 Tax=Basidiobolus ranarum TaxID=34480 RepID=A0ABR2WWT5_9FUNG